MRTNHPTEEHKINNNPTQEQKNRLSSDLTIIIPLREKVDNPAEE